MAEATTNNAANSVSNSLSKRDSLRSKLLSKKGFPSKLAKIKVDGEEITVELREPSIRLWGEINNKAVEFSDGSTKISMSVMMTQTLIACCYVPGTDERIFSDEDYEILLDARRGGPLTELYNIANEFESSKKELKEVKKS